MGDWYGRTDIRKRMSWHFVTHIHEELCTRGPSIFSLVSLIYDMMDTELFSIRGCVSLPAMLWRGTKSK
jgi:hypothetical protein